MSWFDDYRKAWDAVAKGFADAIKKTEGDIGRALSDEEKKLAVSFGLLYLFEKYGPKKGEDDGKEKKNDKI